MNIDEAKKTFRSPNRDYYPELKGYARDDCYRDFFGGGGLYLAVHMLRTMRLQPGDIVLDLGCGKGETSVFLARHYGVHVIALDLWTDATYLSKKFTARGYRDCIIPLHMDVCQELPFADEYLDAVFCMNSFSFYGGSIEFLQHLLRHLKVGGQLCIGSEVLSDEFTEEQLRNPPHVYAFRLPPPNQDVDVFHGDFAKQHTPQWWQRLCESSGLLQVEQCGSVDDADVLYEELVMYEHEHNTDPFDVGICLQQIEWGRYNKPHKSLFTLTAHKL